MNEKSTDITWLYLKSKKGDKVQAWGIENLYDGSYITHSGDVGGKITISAPTFCEPKNVGKKNETNPISQCEIEVKAKIQKKRDKGYGDNPEGEERPFVPTLAHYYEDHCKKIKFPGYVSSKLDGMRCVVRKEGMFSRERNPILSAPHIRKSLDAFFELNPDAIIDGELYADKKLKNFNDIMSLVKQQKPNQNDLDESEKYIEFHVFDAVLEESFNSRLIAITALLKNYKYIKIVPHHRVESEQEMMNWHKLFTSQGFEGTMLRWGNDGYIFERTDKLLKYKDWFDEEFLVSRILSGRGKRANTTAKWELFDGKGGTFEAGISGTDAENLDYYLRRGEIEGKKYATIKFQERTPDGVPRFGNFKAIRDFV